jgi:hypothetical protein
MRSRTIAIAGSITALMFAAAPVTAVAATKAHHRPATESRLDRSRDAKGVRHTDKVADDSKDRADKSLDKSPADSSRDVRDW